MISDATIDDLLQQLHAVAHAADTELGLPLWGQAQDTLRLVVLRWLDGNKTEIRERTP